MKALITIAGTSIYEYNRDLTPTQNYRYAIMADMLLGNKQKLQLKKAYDAAGYTNFNGKQILPKIDFELWIKANINNESMVCLGDVIIREVHRVLKQIGHLFSELTFGVFDGIGRWLDDNILQPLGDAISKLASLARKAWDSIFGGVSLVSTYLSKDLGFGMDTEILKELNSFRSRYVMSDPRRSKMLEAYYVLARCIIRYVLKNNPKKKAYYYENMVVGTYNLIKFSNDEKAYDNYCYFVTRMVFEAGEFLNDNSRTS